jgi:hypothetical protein
VHTLIAHALRSYFVFSDREGIHLDGDPNEEEGSTGAAREFVRRYRADPGGLETLRAELMEHETQVNESKRGFRSSLLAIDD